VACDGTPLLGVVFDPVESVLWQAVWGMGVMRNGVPFVLTENKEMSLTLFHDASLRQHPDFAKIVRSLGAEMRLGECGGAVINACKLLENAPACYLKLPRNGAGGGALWDYAATACIVSEAGGVATDFMGEPLDLNRVGSTSLAHRGVFYATSPRLAEYVRSICL